LISPKTPATAAVVKALTQFGLRLFRELTLPSGDHTASPLSKNVFFSPFSVAAALAMLYDGASGQTREAMTGVLGLEGLNRDEVNGAYAGLMAELTSPNSDMQLEIANSLWAKEGVPLKPEYIERNRDSYRAEIAVTDFSPATVQRINAWVSNSTHGMIKEIVQELEPLTILVALNAIYFKGIWAEQFKKQQTEFGQFTLLNGKPTKCLMMSLSNEFGYYEDESIQAIRLPYRGGKVSMYIFLPSRDLGLDRFLQYMNVEQWDRWLITLSQSVQRVYLKLPRFKIECEAILNEPLKALGMQVAFDRGGAEFDEMCQDCPERLFVSLVKTRVYVDVNEEGTEAAAVSDWSMNITGIHAVHIPEMVVDHPFFVAIRDDQTGAPLFAGVIVDPMRSYQTSYGTGVAL
jgi:serine protease inhibitor